MSEEKDMREEKEKTKKRYGDSAGAAQPERKRAYGVRSSAQVRERKIYVLYIIIIMRARRKRRAAKDENHGERCVRADAHDI